MVMLVILDYRDVFCKYSNTVSEWEEMRQIRESKDVYVIIVNYGDVFQNIK